jgi:hypothetical protein
MLKKLVLIGAVLMVALLALGAAGLAYAQEPQPTEPVPFGQGFSRGGGMMGRGGGMMGRWNQGANGQYGPMHEYMVGSMSDALGMTVEELNAELAAGKTMWQVAEAKGLSLEETQSLMLDARKAAFEKMVADGVITQEQADWMLSRMQGMRGQGGAQGGCPMQGGGGRWGTPPTQTNPAPSSNG